MIQNCLIAFIISMVPLIEIRGAIPYALISGVPAYIAYPVCILGNMLPVPIIFFFSRKVLEWGKDTTVLGTFFTLIWISRRVLPLLWQALCSQER